MLSKVVAGLTGRVVLAGGVAAALALAGCSGGEPAEPKPEVDETAELAKNQRKAGKPVTRTGDPPPKALEPPADAAPALLDPKLATETAPAEYKVKFETTQGDFVVLVHREWAPGGADRFYNLVKAGFYDNCKFFRTIEGFMVQFGISAYPAVSEVWREARIDDDPVKEHNTRGRITFATSGKNSRTSQVFINFVDNSKLDPMGFAPFGEVVEGMENVDKLYNGYGEGAPRGRGPDQGRIQKRGNAYLDAKFPKLDGIVKATIQ